MRVIGVDPSLACTAVVVADMNFKVDSITSMTTSPSTPCSDRIKNICAYVVDSINAHTTANEVKFVFIERPVGRNMQSFWKLSLLGGALQSCVCRQVPNAVVTFVHPATPKRLCAGAGNAQKEDVAKAMQKVTGGQAPCKNHDESDALSIAYAGWLNVVNCPLEPIMPLASKDGLELVAKTFSAGKREKHVSASGLPALSSEEGSALVQESKPRKRGTARAPVRNRKKSGHRGDYSSDGWENSGSIPCG